MLSEKALQEFKNLWKEKFGEEISDDFALEQAVNLLTVFDKIYRPLKREWVEQNPE